jgi:hypothetical protein
LAKKHHDVDVILIDVLQLIHLNENDDEGCVILEDLLNEISGPSDETSMQKLLSQLKDILPDADSGLVRYSIVSQRHLMMF